MAFVDNRKECKEALHQVGIKSLHEICGEIEAQTKRNSKVASGDTKGHCRRFCISDKGYKGTCNKISNIEKCSA